MKRLTIIAVALALAATAATAAVRPVGLFSDNAVLQRGMPVPVWGFADNGEKVTVSFAGQQVSTTAKDGKWMVRLAPMKAGGPYKMTIAGSNTVELSNILVGEVWVCSGQSNMTVGLNRASTGAEAIAAATDPNIRLFTVQTNESYAPLDDVKASWQVCSPQTAPDFSAVAYFFGRDLRRALGVPIGLIHSSYGGTLAEAWTTLDGFKELPEYASSIADDYAKKPGGRNHYSVCYNAMIAPLIPYAIEGVIWYQGEQNDHQAYAYRWLFPALIKSWRTAWGEGDFPFLFVQIAPLYAFKAEPSESRWAEVQESQLLTWEHTPETGMVVTTDVGDSEDQHPPRKEPVGDRLALAARKIAYGENIVYSGPIYKGMKVTGNSITVYFNHVEGGLVAKGGPLTGFTIAGEDHRFFNATANIVDGNKIVVSSPSVAKPMAVRYAWADFPIVNLYNKEDLPASPFRTDDFQLLTEPKK